MNGKLFKILGVSIAIFFTSQLANSTAAQLFGSQKTSTQFIPESAAGAAIIFPKRMAENPDFDDLPREILTAYGKKELGFDPLLINQATLLVKVFDTLDRPPQWGAVLHFEEMQGLSGGMIDNLEQKEIAGKQMFSGTAGMPSFLVYDEATIFVGDESFFPDMIAAANKGRISDLIKSGNVDGQLLAYLDVEALRPAFNKSLAQLPGGLPPAVNKLKKVPDLAEAIELGVTIDGRVRTKMIVHASDEDAAQEVEKIVNNALEFGLEMGIGVLASQLDFGDPVQEATVEYAQRAGKAIKTQLTPQVSGTEVEINMTEESSVIPIMIGMLLPAVQQVRASARRVSSNNQMRQMILAGLNYESANQHFPAQASYDKDGKPLLSWRVHVLPYLEQNDLYEQFHLDEPWDSPHNRKLISKMPPIFENPALPDLDGKTTYLGVAGKGLMFDGKEERKFSDITDGSSNTVFMVEVDASHAVEWTKPQDYQFDPKRPMDGLGGVQPGGFNVTLADGSAHFVSNNVDAETWKSMLTIAGGELEDAVPMK